MSWPSFFWGVLAALAGVLALIAWGLVWITDKLTK